ncbi:hypothetical protein DJ568_15515 [Mucilaginibacter hurinus]|uniref:Uncharacterized protein n=1 Tax=Mucilaginibacter hurinus TaxID=2201324 RepID=A0A367GM53_9SPHI|nr:hypothetical protein [Mucilaginibacter hurinus]RCH53946.1 hypothetical protein DJ568_15515 [Mucilaginibacter hurinus]
MSTCGKITANRKFNCATPLVGNTKDYAYIFNQDDIDVLVRDNANPQIVRSITLKSEKKGYRWESPANGITSSSKLVRKKYKNVYEQVVGLPVTDNNSAIKKELESAGYGKFFIVLENNHQAGDAIFEGYGLDLGLIILTNEKDNNNNDTDGAYVLSFGQEETAREAHLPVTVAALNDEQTPAYSYAETKEMLEALIQVDPS